MITYIVNVVFALDNDWIDVNDFNGNRSRYSVIGNARFILESIHVVPVKVTIELDQYDNVTNIEYV